MEHICSVIQFFSIIWLRDLGMLVIPDIKLKKGKKKKKTTVCFKVFNVFRSMCCEVIWNLKFFLSNCTAPIYCNVIKNSYCEFLSQFALSPRISASHLCNGISCELARVWQLFSIYFLYFSLPVTKQLSLPTGVPFLWEGGCCALTKHFIVLIHPLWSVLVQCSVPGRASLTGAHCSAALSPVVPKRPCSH